MPHEERVIRTAIQHRGKHELIQQGSLQAKRNADHNSPGNMYNTRGGFYDSAMGNVPLNDPGSLLERQAKNRQKWQMVLTTKQSNMQKKQAEMKAMLAKGFKKEKAVKEFQDMQIDNRKFDLEKKQEHYGLVKDRKQKEDRVFYTKMNEAVKKYNEKHALAEANRVQNIMAGRNQTVDDMMSGSQTKLDHMTS